MKRNKLRALILGSLFLTFSTKAILFETVEIRKIIAYLGQHKISHPISSVSARCRDREADIVLIAQSIYFQALVFG
jgi:hypothetical protein